MTQWVYAFDDPGALAGDGSARLGGKGACLAQMSALGLPVPPGFTLTTGVCAHFLAHGGRYPDDLAAQVAAALARLEAAAGARFGDGANPLLVSVRSGARASMPGMMDTILNLGLNDVTARALAARSGDARFAYDSYRRFIQMYASVVLGIDHAAFEERLESLRADQGTPCDAALDAAALARLVRTCKSVVRAACGTAFPQDPQEQLWGAIGAVLGSWMNPRAVSYRELCGESAGPGTAVTIQAMVFGNMGGNSGSGAACTRDPSTGENRFSGEFAANAQGEDVVAGLRTPQPLLAAGRGERGSGRPAMQEAMPRVFDQLEAIRHRLEAHYRDMQDIEFTVQQGRLYMLQTRRGKRTAAAALRIAVELVEAGIISRDEALLRICPQSLDQLMRPALAADGRRKVIAAGLPASAGAASGRVAFDPEAAERLAGDGEPVILVRTETSPDDIRGMHAARGILTARGGRNSHAAAIARAMGRACVVGAGQIRIDAPAGRFHAGGITVAAGDVITIDGSAGEVMLGEAAMTKPVLSGAFDTLMRWAGGVCDLDMRAVAATPEAAAAARAFGADGLGVLDGGRILAAARSAAGLSGTGETGARESGERARDRLLDAQRQGFKAIFGQLAGAPVAIRPVAPQAAPAADGPAADGSPGPDGIGAFELQVRAIFGAAAATARRDGGAVVPELLLPFAASDAWLARLGDAIDRIVADIRRRTGVEIEYFVGRIREIALPDGFDGAAATFGVAVDDLRGLALGIGRDDRAGLLDHCRACGIIPDDPFAGAAAAPGSESGRKDEGDLITVCETPRRSYVSCPPARITAMRLAAAQAAIRSNR